ncbi:lipopolysaccharide biosynthesis protein [Flavicella marina]|uniref:lipopolysaccharide biosynthesis protein n=1 Tax=Flavicella marina TaxID=1475951 RepID=UPI001264F4A8|nr:oligosaccharide flippase family protein [Flavicella marina]
MGIFKQILNSQITHFIGVKYLTFGIQFVNSLLIAKYLGVFYFGIYSFLILLNQYLTYLGMIPSYSLNAILSTKKKSLYYSKRLWHNTLLLTLILCFLVSMIGVLLVSIYPTIFAKYQFYDYFAFVFLIFSVSAFNNVFTNLYRTYGELNKINFNQFIVPFFQLVVLILFNTQSLIYFLLLAMVIGNICSLILFLNNSPISLGFGFKGSIMKEILTRGGHLLMYNVSFYLLLLSSRTIVSIEFSPEKLGFYSLAVSLSSAVFMVVGSVSFLVYPKLLNKFYANDSSDTKKVLVKIRELYIASCFLLTYMGFLLVPILIVFIPKYSMAMTPFKILLFTQLIFNNSFGYSVLLVAKKKEKIMTKICLYSVVIIVGLSILFAKLGFSINLIAVSVLVGFTYYVFKLTKVGMKEFNYKVTYHDVYKELFPRNFLIPLVFILISLIIENDFIFIVLSFLFFIFLNKKRIIQIIIHLQELVSNNNSLKF